MLKSRLSHCVKLALGLAFVFCAVPHGAGAEPLTMQSSPEAVARAVLGTQPGSVAVGLWRDGAAVSAEVRRGAGDAVTVASSDAPPSLFEIGSISKVFTGVLLAQAVEQGDLALDDKLGKLLRGQGKVQLQPLVADITLRQLVTHSSCLPRMPANFPDGDAPNPYVNYSRAKLWEALAALKLEHPGPCPAVYSNMGFAVLGELLSQRYGQPWEALVIGRIAKPLGMRDTMQHLGTQAARLAPAFSGDAPAPPWDFEAFAGAGALRSTAADMLLFGRALMAGGGGPLGAAAERVMQPLGSMNGAEIGYALMMRGPVGQRSYMHDGGTGGFRSELMLTPDLAQVSIIMASNAQAPAGMLSSDVLGARFRLVERQIVVDAASLSGYAGVFRMSPTVAFTFVVQDGQLYGRLTGQAFNALTPAAADVFTFPKVGAEFSFQRDGGKVAGVTLRQRGAEMKAALSSEAPPSAAFDPAVTQAAFDGHYLVSDPALPKMDFTVRARNGQLAGRLNEQPMFPVFPVPGKADRYALDVVAAEYQFERDAQGVVTALVLHQNGRAIRAARVPAPATSPSPAPPLEKAK